MKVAFRVDSSKTIASGHAMRCLTLARVLRDAGHECTFVCRDLPLNFNALIAQHFPVFLLPAPSSDFLPTKGDTAHAAWAGVSWQQDAAESRAAIDHADWLVVDHYALDARWEDAMSSCAPRVLVLDDLADRQHRCNLLLDQSLGRHVADYAGLVPDHCHLLLGPEHVLLRPEFARLRNQSLKRSDGKLDHIVVAMGGIDAENAVSDVLRAISRLPNARNLTVSIAISGRAPHLKELQNLVAELLFQATLFIDSAEIANLMLKADLAISTSGMMGYELACMGLPMLLLPTSPIQAKVAKELALQTEARVVADWAIYPEDNIFLALTSFLQHLKDLPFEKRLVSRTFDGAGASRVALALAERFGAQ